MKNLISKHEFPAYRQAGEVRISNTNALNLIMLNGIAPRPIPLPSGERGG